MALCVDIENGLHQQADHCALNSAHSTAAICRAMVQLAKGNTDSGRKIADWPRGIIDDAVPLRLAAGLHDLFRQGLAPELGAVYRGETLDQTQVDALIGKIVRRHDAALLPWFDSAPQTNEAGRSSSFVAALHWLAGRVSPKFELMEIGSSAGMNLLIDRFRYDLSGVVTGPNDAPVTIRPEWRGPPPPATQFIIHAIRGCDLNPIDVCNDAAAERLRAYIWPEMPERFARMDAGIKMVRECPVDLVKADAADWTEAQLALPQESGTTRVLMHSIVWQYLPNSTQARITSAMEHAALVATHERPLAWIALETNRVKMRHELHVRYWPGGNTAIKLGEAHAHGTWVEWMGI